MATRCDSAIRVNHLVNATRSASLRSSAMSGNPSSSTSLSSATIIIDARARIGDDADCVIGDRTLQDSDIEVARRAYREWGSQQFRRLLRWWLGLGDFPDTQCGFKFFRGPVMRELFGRMQIDGYMFDVELLLLATKSGHRVDRIPVRWRDDADSRFHPVSGSVRNLRELARIRRTHR